MRAPSSGARATGLGAASFTSFATRLLTIPGITIIHHREKWVGAPVFAPTGRSTAPGSEWIVYPHYFRMGSTRKPFTSARLNICEVRFDSTWVSWNLEFRPARTLRLSRSSRAGCVRVRQYSRGRTMYDRNFYLPTGIYLR